MLMRWIQSSCPSARKHGVADGDMLHAYHHPVRVFAIDDLTMLIDADEAGRVLEVGVASAEGFDFIVHAPCQPDSSS